MGPGKGSLKYWVPIVNLARILHDISGVRVTLFPNKTSFVNFGTSQFSSKLPNGR